MSKTLLSTLFVGIDVSKKSNHVHAIDFYERTYLRGPFDNNRPGAEKLQADLLEILYSHPFTHVTVALESTSIYSTHIASFLASSLELKLYNTMVYVLNPKVVKKYRDTFVDLQKTDPEDTYLLADFARIGKIKAMPWKGDQHIALKRLTRHRLHLVEQLTREKSYLQANLFLKFSEFSRLDGQDKLFSNSFGATASAVISNFLSLDELAYMPDEELVNFIMEKGKHHFNDPQAVVSKLKKAVRDSYRLDKAAYEPLQAALTSSMNVLQVFQRELRAIDKAIEKAVRGFEPNAYKILLSIPGVGPVYAAGILAEIGDIHAFTSQDALAEYAGISWSRNQSGQFESEHSHLTKRGNKYLRYYFFEAANLTRRWDDEYQKYYQRKYKESKNHHHMRALSLTARKFVRLVFGLLDKNTLFDAQKSSH